SGAGGADLEAGIEGAEPQFLGVRRARERPLRLRAVGVEALDHFEQILRGARLVGEDEGAQAAAAAGAVIEPPADVGRAALLPALEHERADAAEFGALRFEPRVDVPLRAIEYERQGGAALGADAQ